MEKNREEIQRLEEILRSNPDSPVFAQIANLYIESGEYVHALALCDRGTSMYPEYATGFLLRAAALRHLDKYEESIENYRKVLEILPRCTVAGKWIAELQKKLEESKKKVVPETTKQPEAEHKVEKGSIEELADRLKEYKPERPSSDVKHSEPAEESDVEENDLPIVSETLANIFFKQKQFDRAVEAYRQLMKRNPERADIYLTKIKQVEEAKKNEQ